jgi:3-oxoacyl-[acyl-carrier protein] reductase
MRPSYGGLPPHRHALALRGVGSGLRGNACIVCGADDGIGRATARLLVGEGADLLLVGRDPAAGESGGVPLPADVHDPDAAARVVAACLERFGRLDALVCPAPRSAPAPLAGLSDADWQAHWDRDAMAPLRLLREAAPVMAAAGYGRIVVMASAAGKQPVREAPAHSVVMAAALSLSRAFADRYAGDGVLVNAVAPDLVGGSAEEAAAVVAFLCSPACAAVSGAAWSADGGAVRAIT